MKTALGMLGFLCLLFAVNICSAQSAPSQDQTPPPAGAARPEGHAYSGMYSFLKDGEFVQITVEDGGRVTGFISRYGEGESDKGAFLDQFFKTVKLEGNNLSFTTDIVHGVAFEFKGSVQRGEGKTTQDEGYYVLKGTLTQNTNDVNNKVSTRPREVVLKSFPQDAAPAGTPRK
jgi:hypothetical protein